VGASITLKALGLGAFDFVAKPQEAASGSIDQIASELALKIKVAAASGAPKLIISEPALKQGGMKGALRLRKPARIFAIGISTGGPNALEYVFSQLPEDFPGCLLVVQHMPEGFTGMFARRLNESSAIEVKEAQSGDLLLAGRALICPGNRHMKVRRLEHGNIVVLDDLPKINGHRPSADVLFESVAREFSAMAVAMLMTGMGDDGAAGMGAVRSAGGLTIAQSLDTCVVESMPRAAIERDFAMRIVPIHLIASTLQLICAGAHGPLNLETSPLAPEAIPAESFLRRRLS
jgi:two-component system chemotaxis response regulator CheB